MTCHGHPTADSDATMANNMNILLDVCITFYRQAGDSAVTGSNKLQPYPISDRNSLTYADKGRIEDKQRPSNARTLSKLLEKKPVENDPFHPVIQSAKSMQLVQKGSVPESFQFLPHNSHEALIPQVQNGASGVFLARSSPNHTAREGVT